VLGRSCAHDQGNPDARLGNSWPSRHCDTFGGPYGAGVVSLQKAPSDVVAAIRSAACPLPAAKHYDRVLSWIDDASIVLLGESTHGTHEFYSARAALTRRLIEERGFSAVAIEGDWPDAYRVNRYIRSGDVSGSPQQALRGFARFPTWMWRNADLVEFVAWLHHHNTRGAGAGAPVGFYGLDLYSLHASMRAVVDFLDRTDPAAAREARRAYSCFNDFGEDTESYAWAASRQGESSCEDAVTQQLITLRARAADWRQQPANAQGLDDFFSAEQNARLAANAERYYRTMFHGRVASWNLRDTHMAETLDELLGYLSRQGRARKVVVWAHNSHVGDARATELGEHGEHNLGQLAREAYGNAVRLIGFSSHHGTVMAASEWGGDAEVKTLRPALPGSLEDVFNQTGLPRLFLPLTTKGPAREALTTRRLERAVGVIYRPESERMSHYFEASVADQFDAMIHFDETHAVQPLERESQRDDAEVPETFPSGV
jgi:erythromycin esterase-like protein